MTGSAHDAWAFEHTAAAKYPNWFFSGEEFAWADSAYAVTPRTIPVHKKPAALLPENTAFDRAVANLRVWSEHCMGALKGRFQCFRGLRVNINSKRQHISACQWITVGIILHNIVIEVEGAQQGLYFAPVHTHHEEVEDRGPHDAPLGGDDNIDGEMKRKKLVEELVAFQDM
ncbi:hypothetical protein M405DRAFT_750843 [Rhizopogon salebrosus TDB-379]|nr:hypothetical protein M405DRAFT_750843 [Rhizopogon salebrosus TDB-379]